MPNLARDLDLVRDLMGLKTLNFFGFEEGGSVLGATYAVMFPDRVGRIVLDGMLCIASILIHL
jgi:pimeloyl-ACP methyl ester carboxylesterase